jgi:hypothetical protein
MVLRNYRRKKSRYPKWDRGFQIILRLGLLNQSSLDGFDRNPNPLGAAICETNADPLKVGPELALRDAGHVRADAAALLGLAFTVDDAPFDGTTTCDYANFAHGVMS